MQKAIKKKGIEKMEKYFKGKEVHLWGERKSLSFVMDSMLLTIYHDINMKGYMEISKEVKRWYNVNHKSLNHNIYICRKELYEWMSDVWFCSGDYKDWNKDAKICRLIGEFKNANLWMDSTDIPKEGIRKYSRKSREWSYKLKRPGRFYMVIMYAKRRIRFKFNGYFNKIYNKDFLKAKQEYLDLVCLNGIIVADNHFEKGRKMFKNVKFLVNYKEKKDNSIDDNTKEVINLTYKQRAFNKKHRKVRARVESPFGEMKNSFKCLKIPFRDGDEQMDYAVTYIMGFHNINIKK
jgi:hypothetical protein